MTTRFDDPDGMVAALAALVRTHPDATVTKGHTHYLGVDPTGRVLGHLDPSDPKRPFIPR